MIGVFLAAAATSVPTKLEGVQLEGKRYAACVTEHARKLEPSGEPSSTVIAGALSACRATRERVADALLVDLLYRGESPSSERVERAMAEVDRRLTDQVLPVVLQQRAVARRSSK